MNRRLDYTFPSDNEWGIPMLDASQQGCLLPAPFMAWGSIARPTRMPGCYHFYVDDSKFSALWNDPATVLLTQCAAVVEPNFSSGDQTPLARVIWDVYRKRWMARYWQSQGVKLIVDLNVADAFQKVNLIGVPRGWTAFATRYTSRGGIEAIERQAQAAHEHTGVQANVVVYSGGREIRDRCLNRGWQWFPNQASWHRNESKRQSKSSIS